MSPRHILVQNVVLIMPGLNQVGKPQIETQCYTVPFKVTPHYTPNLANHHTIKRSYARVRVRALGRVSLSLVKRRKLCVYVTKSLGEWVSSGEIA